MSKYDDPNWTGVQPVIDESVRALCVRPYHGHPKGCPNFGKKSGCPPLAPMIDRLMDLRTGCWAIFNRFPLGAHVEKMKKAHPGWSDRQLACCLYWQGTARKQLKAHISRFTRAFPTCEPWIVVACPEACGVNMTLTMAPSGIELEWPPREWAYQIVLAGRPLGNILEAALGINHHLPTPHEVNT